MEVDLQGSTVMDVSERRPVVVASHPRPETHLLIDTLRRQFEACRSWKWPGERLDRLYCSIDELNADRGRLDERTARRIVGRTPRPLVKTHAWPGYQETFLREQHDGLSPDWTQWIDEQGTVLYVYRDGRDVLCSYHLFRQKFDPDAGKSVGAFLRETENGTSRVRRWADHVRAWREEENVHLVQFERLIEDPEAVLQEIGDVLGLVPTGRTPFLPRSFDSIWESRWARLTQMRPESRAIINGEKQDWREAFAAADRAFFHQEAGALLMTLGYTESADWIENPPSPKHA
jgi:hypothetical protein